MTTSLARRRILGYVGAACAVGASLPAWPQSAGTLRLLVGFPAGGTTDAIARLVAHHVIGWDAVMIDNRAGAGGRLAMQALARAKPDGTTLVMTPDYPLTVSPHLYRKLGYEPFKDFEPVAMTGVSPFALCVGPAVPSEVTTVNGFLQWCRKNPKLAVYGSPAPGSTLHFAGVMLAQAARIDLLHVAYKGGAPAIQDVLGGQISASINPLSEVLPHLPGGKLRVLATTGAARSPLLPDVPTLSESGYRDVIAQSWLGVFAPAGTPESVLTALEQTIAQALKKEAVVDGFAKLGFTMTSLSRQQFRALIRDDYQRWTDVVKASGFTVEE